jgi:hypothetical protein
MDSSSLSNSYPPAQSTSNLIRDNNRGLYIASSMPMASSPPAGPTSQEPISQQHSNVNKLTHDSHTHGLDLPWVTRNIEHSSSSANLTAPSSPSQGLTHRVSELNLSAHPSRHPNSRKNQSRTACFVHSLLQNGRARSPSRTGSSDELTRGSMLEAISRGPERRDRWNRGMTKKELSDMALGVRELSKRLGITCKNISFLTVGGARMKLKVKTVIVITKKHDHALVGMTRQVTDWLLHHSAGKKEPYTVYFLKYYVGNW